MTPPSGSPNDDQPLVEVNVSYEHGPTPSRTKMLDPIEIVTRNHVYVLDTTMHCTEVRKASSGEAVLKSGFLGSRLVGGQVTSDDATEISYPFPRPGAIAVFESARGRAFQFHHTSPVVRVVLRLSIISVTTQTVAPTWEQISRATRPPTLEPQEP